MFTCKEYRNVLIHISGKDFADLIQCLTRNNNLSGRIMILENNLTDRNTMSIQRYHFQYITINFK